MKILVAVVALALVIGPDALVVRANEYKPMPKLQVLVGGISALVVDANIKVARKFELLKNSKAGKAVSDQFGKLMEPLTSLENQVPEELSNAADVVFSISWGILEKAYNTFHAVERHSSNNLEHAVRALDPYLDPVLVKAQSYAEPLLDPLHDKILELNQELDERIAHTMESLDGQLSFYVKRVEEIRDGLQPLAEEVAKQCRLGMETLNKNLKPYLDRFLEESSKYTVAFREWVKAPLYPRNES